MLEERLRRRLKGIGRERREREGDRARGRGREKGNEREARKGAQMKSKHDVLNFNTEAICHKFTMQFTDN